MKHNVYYALFVRIYQYGDIAKWQHSKMAAKQYVMASYRYLIWARQIDIIADAVI